MRDPPRRDVREVRLLSRAFVKPLLALRCRLILLALGQSERLTQRESMCLKMEKAAYVPARTGGLLIEPCEESNVRFCSTKSP